jgi:hypothetical protein
MKGYYVYMYLRSKSSPNGEIGTPYYIGKGNGSRIQEFHGRHIAVPKSSENRRTVSEGLNEADAFQLEMLLIHQYGRIDLGTGCLHNLTDGGEGARRSLRKPQSEALKARKSVIMKEWYLKHGVSKERRDKIRTTLTRYYQHNTNPRAGSVTSEEQKTKVSQAMKQVWSVQEHPMKGKPRSESTKQAMSVGMKEYYKNGGIPPGLGVSPSVLTREKISQKLTGVKHSEERRRRRSEQMKSMWAKRKAEKNDGNRMVPVLVAGRSVAYLRDQCHLS